MLEINIKIYLKITCLFSSAMWHLPRESFDLATKSLSEIRLKKRERLQRRKHLYEKWVSIWEINIKNGQCVCSQLLQSCLTLCDPVDWSQPGFSVRGILQARTLERVEVPLAGDLPNPGTEPVSPALQADSLLLSQQGSPSVV